MVRYLLNEYYDDDENLLYIGTTIEKNMELKGNKSVSLSNSIGNISIFYWYTMATKILVYKYDEKEIAEKNKDLAIKYKMPVANKDGNSIDRVIANDYADFCHAKMLRKNYKWHGSEEEISLKILQKEGLEKFNEVKDNSWGEKFSVYRRENTRTINKWISCRR